MPIQDRLRIAKPKKQKARKREGCRTRNTRDVDNTALEGLNEAKALARANGFKITTTRIAGRGSADDGFHLEFLMLHNKTLKIADFWPSSGRVNIAGQHFAAAGVLEAAERIVLVFGNAESVARQRREAKPKGHQEKQSKKKPGNTKIRVGPKPKAVEAQKDLDAEYQQMAAEWRQLGGQHSAPIGDSTKASRVELQASCGPHNNPAQWDYTPDRYGRPGWRTAHCKTCGRFIGYQPPQ